MADQAAEHLLSSRKLIQDNHHHLEERQSSKPHLKLGQAIHSDPSVHTMP